MFDQPVSDVAILIVGYRNPDDIGDCLRALAKSVPTPDFDVFICENGGERSYQRLLDHLRSPAGVCQAVGDEGVVPTLPPRFVAIECLQLNGRNSKVWVGCANENLGYAGGVNVWLEPLRGEPNWRGVWILNPDTEPEAGALAALVERAECGGKGMVGSTIFDTSRPDEVRCRGGLRWGRLTARTTAVGFGEPIRLSRPLSAVEGDLDSPSGASMYVTRACLETIGGMDERYFLFFEDLEWGVRAKACGLGYAPASMVGHKRGTTTGSANALANIPQLTIFLEQRNGILFARKYFPLSLPARIAGSLLYAARLLAGRAPRNAWTALAGVLAGIRGETGQPTKYMAARPGG